jgi:hypothetical protein
VVQKRIIAEQCWRRLTVGTGGLTMADEYIERGALLAAYDKEHEGEPGRARKLIEGAPAADVQPVRHGRWKENEAKQEGNGTLIRKYWNCTECGIEICSTLPVFDLSAWHYCPNCGAKMDGEA